MESENYGSFFLIWQCNAYSNHDDGATNRASKWRPASKLPLLLRSPKRDRQRQVPFSANARVAARLLPAKATSLRGHEREEGGKAGGRPQKIGRGANFMQRSKRSEVEKEGGRGEVELEIGFL